MSTIKVENLTGITSGANANKIIVPAGQTLDASNGFIAPAGHVIQTVSTKFTTVTSTTSTSYIDINSGTLAITPKFTNSKISVHFNFSLGYSASGAYMYGGFQLLRGSTVITNPPHDGTGAFEFGTSIGSGTTIERYERYSHHLIDSPSTTSAVTYKAQFKAYGAGGGTVTINPGSVSVGNSHIIIQEIAA